MCNHCLKYYSDLFIKLFHIYTEIFPTCFKQCYSIARIEHVLLFVHAFLLKA